MTQRELVFTRVFDAPRELVFKVWTEPKHLVKWWGPKGYTNPSCEIDLRPGGVLLTTMQGPDGRLIPTKGVFKEIIPPERLVFITSGFEDAEGQPQLEVLNIAMFADENGKTKLTLQTIIVRGTPEVEGSVAGMEQGWNESLDKLAEAIASA